MSALRTCVDALLGSTKIFKIGLAFTIKSVANFLNTTLGKIATLLLLFTTIYLVWHFFRVALVPIIVGAGARRGLLFVLIVFLPPSWRRGARTYISEQMHLLKCKWGATTPLKRFMLKLAVATILCILALHYFHVTDILTQVVAILPIPVFVYVYLGEKIPRLISAFVQRQGLGKIVFDGGWQLFPMKWRTKARRFINRSIVRNIAGPRAKVLKRFTRMREARKQRKLSSISHKALPASD